MRHYNLGFISDENIVEHVKNTVEQYRNRINLKDFNQNLIDPIKMTFDSKIYNQSIEETITAECLRQVDKTNNNKIGYFHQNIFQYAGNGWVVLKNGVGGGFDIINEDLHIFVEMKNKHNTLNSSSASNIYLKMQDKILKDDKAICYLVEVIAHRSQNDPWSLTIPQNGHKNQYSHERIRRISIDKFYELVFPTHPYAFSRLCKVLPTILDDIIASDSNILLENSVLNELNTTDFYRQLYRLAFKNYEGFSDF
ncbi:MAG: Eco47II family restriction endonuclease [Bacteroides sp.]